MSSSGRGIAEPAARPDSGKIDAVEQEGQLFGPHEEAGKRPAKLSITHNSEVPDQGAGPWKEAPALGPLVAPIQ